ncbi:hypothetical protein N7471_003744 [Penicillium samsonianum]|uniref:uncharacterized protein n=1 Tax=Penicillium samsonianum TaxID=1882272 RepID=UPI002549AAFF|nr:uncharacterized protein N7471_003744 [Penicillium samsonianum]KAJ6137258.1 hypothetical protein N7471_003744 [Penicillium samsonianum]
MNQNEELVNLLVQKVRQVSPDLIGRCLEATGNLKIARTCLEFCDEIYKGFELSITCTDTRQTGPGTLLGVVCWNRSTIEATVIAEHLLERGANVDAWHIFPAPAHRHKNLVTTPLGLAAARGNVQLMKILLEAGANLRPDGVLGCLSPLVLAVHYKQHFAVELLTKWGAPDENIERKLDFIETTPSYALPNQIEMMMQNEAMRTMVIENGMKRDLMILRAIETDEANLVQMLLETKTLGGATRCCVSNTLGRAIGQGKRDIITLLLNAGAHLELRYVFSIGDLKTAMYLEERGLLHSLLREKGRWILTTAIMAADRALIDFLLENSADRSSSSPPTNFSQLDALLRDHKSPSSSCSSYHYSYGDFVEPGRLCVTPLEAALCRGYFELAKILLRRGAPVKEREINALVWNAINFRHLLVHTFEFLDLVSTTRTLPCAPTALKMAISSGGQLLVRSLLEAGIGVVGTYFVPSDVVDPIILYRLRHRGERSCKLAGWWNWTGENKAHPATFASEYVNLQFSQAQSDSQTLVKMLGPKHRCQSISLLEHAVEKSEKCTFSILLQVDAWTPEDLGKAIVKSLQLDRKDLTPGLLASAAKLYKKGHFCSSLNFGPKEADAQTVNHFISAGCSLDYIFGSPKMALCEAIEYEQMALVDILLRAGVHLDEMVAPTEVSAFFQIAVKQNHHKLMDMLLLAGADVNTPATSRDMGTALQIAVGKENLQLTQWLLEIGANVNGAPWRDSGRTALQAAVLQGNLELVNKLLDIGADVNQSPADSSGATALQLAAIRGYISIAQKLIGRGANINGSRGHHFGRTALEGAAEHGRTDMLQLLLDGGSFLEGEGRRELIRAVKLAVKNERHAISRYLKSFVDWNDSDNECFQKEVFDQEEKDMLGKKA